MPLLKLKSIRMKSLQEERFRKYLLYALGEILLVIAGILIALQINGWNDRRQKIAGLERLQASVKGELEINLESLRQDLQETDEIRRGCQDLLNRMVRDTIPAKQLDSLIGSVMGYAMWRPNTFALDEMINTGSFSALQQPELKEGINRYRAGIKNLEEHLGFLELQSNNLMDCVVRLASGRNTMENLPFIDIDKSTLSSNQRLLLEPEFENRLSLKLIALSMTMQEYQGIEASTVALLDVLANALKQ